MTGASGPVGHHGKAILDAIVLMLAHRLDSAETLAEWGRPSSCTPRQRGVHSSPLFNPRELVYCVNMTLRRRTDELTDAVVARLSRLPGLDASWRNPVSGDDAARLEVHGPLGSVAYLVEIELKLTARMVGPIAARLASSRTRRLLITRYASPPAIDALVAAGLEFADAEGNAYLSSPAAHVFTRGHKVRASRGGSSLVTLTPAKLKVLFVLLRDKRLRQVAYRDIAAAAGVSLGAVSNAVRSLCEVGHLRKGRRDIRLVDFDAALKAWEVGYADRLRPSLHPRRFTMRQRGAQSLEVLRRRLEANEHDRAEPPVVLSGELGAAVLTGHLRAGAATLHSTSSGRAFMARFRLAPDEDGEILLLDEVSASDAWSEDAKGGVADPLLVRAELLAGGGERQRQTAQRLLQEFILPREAAP